MTAHWLKHIGRLDGAFSDHTLRSYRSDFGLFAAWCRKRRRPFLPATGETVAAYIEAERMCLKPGTLKRRLAAIRKLHQLAGEGDPTRDAEVDLAMRRASRAQPSRPQQALGITAERRDRLLAQCTDDLIGLRDRVLVSVGFDTLCRRGELVALSVTDLTKREDGRYNVLIRRAKNDPEGAGRTAHLSTRSSALVDDWFTAIGATRGPLLRPVYRSRALVLYLEPLTIGRVLKKLSKRADLQTTGPSKVSGHSLRVGAAQQLVLNGRGILQVMRAGGWRSMNVVARYVENVDLDVWS
ncbi:tyrosine-type recombinase/integrase [Devosia salina]|uniref:Tyrosine-type recombinase/integrase n=1 Tax=Devosia salina TaxID=2860336 RepID=A0ABX8WIB6_9HYPH|nr:tyrosine-type recombinase/integrase [Devosia salina]QYO77761.1 tyrosine-type recombinase/integrase [Devosia salina]